MRKIVISICLLAAVMGAGIVAGARDAAADPASWAREFRLAIVSGKGRNLERFFTPQAFEREMPSWKYSLEDGFLEFARTEVVPLSDRAVLLHIPTDNQPYSGEHEDAYFDFIYRVYEIRPDGNSFRIVGKGEDAVDPDFIRVRSRIEIRPREGMFVIESAAEAELKNGLLVFKLAKEFEIGEFRINGCVAPYRRLGYFILAEGDQGKRALFEIRGKLPAARDSNQFVSMDANGFFLRYGGFSAIPGPPPGSDGRYHFSRDQTSFETTYVLPGEFPFVQYGRVLEEKTDGELKVVRTSCDGEWMDNLAFYAQKDWAPVFIPSGNARMAFYFPARDRAVVDAMTPGIRQLLDWSYSIFRAYPESNLNFIVLDRFPRDAALNDGRSIITQDAQTQADDTYIHEILHNVPQPGIKGGFLWQKEGFTQFLSFDFIDFRSGRPEYWKRQQRWFLHAFDQFTEPLSALTNARSMPTYRAAYDKGPWVYRMLSAEIGEANFRKAMLEFAKMKGRETAGPREYFRIFERISGQDLSGFEDQWLNRRENPVLRIERSDERASGDGRIHLRIRQEGAVFRLPLEVEIQGPNDRVRATLRLDSAVGDFSIPVKGPVSSVLYDPDARLFAVIKSGKASFLDPGEALPSGKAAVYRYRSGREGAEIEFRVVPRGNAVAVVRKEKGREAALELSPDLSPLEFVAGGAVAYSLDPASGKIAFPDAAYDVAEPVYPEDFVVWLFSRADWTKVSDRSLLYLRSGTKRCALARAVREAAAGPDVRLKIDTREGTMDARIRDGVLEEFTIDGREKFVLTDR